MVLMDILTSSYKLISLFFFFFFFIEVNVCKLKRIASKNKILILSCDHQIVLNERKFVTVYLKYG